MVQPIQPQFVYNFHPQPHHLVVQGNILVEMGVGNIRPFEHLPLGHMIGTEGEQRIDNRQQFHNPANDHKMLLVLLQIRIGDNPLLDSFGVNFIHNILEEIRGEGICLVDIQLFVAELHMGYVAVHAIHHEF